MTYEIRFGTDGWRGLIADDFTFENVTRCSQGLADYLKERGTANQGLVVGYDTRFLSRQFAERVAQVVAGNGVKVYLCQTHAPTPVVSFNVLRYRAAGAAIITASHNPAIWNGFKFKPEYAGSATEAITNQLEVRIKELRYTRSVSLTEGRRWGLIVDIDPAPPYIEGIRSLVDIKAIQDAGLKVAVDSMHGAGGGYIPRLLAGGKTTVEEMRGARNPAFPGMDQPEPIAHNLSELMQKIGAGGVSVGLALDGDADRLGVVDEQGKFITTLEVFSLLALYLLEMKEQRGPIVKGITASRMLNEMGKMYGVDVHEMRVGFKYIGPRMSEVDAIIGGEESGGFAFRGHIPERDGILSGLYILEYMARTGKTPAELVRHLFDKVGQHYYKRRDIEFQASDRDRIRQRLESPELTELAGMKVQKIDSIDGRRLIFDKAWLASRFSGTEPLLRIYSEADKEETVDSLLNAAQQYLGV